MYTHPDRSLNLLVNLIFLENRTRAYFFISSRAILNEGLTQLSTDRIECKPVKPESSTLTLDYLNSIPYVKARSVCEAGSIITLA
jgi:hypothetical protein